MMSATLEKSSEKYSIGCLFQDCFCCPVINLFQQEYALVNKWSLVYLFKLLTGNSVQVVQPCIILSLNTSCFFFPLTSLVGAEFAAATVLITYGAVLGKVSRLQLLVIGILEVVFYGINELVAIEFLKFSDAGGSILIHTFGAYFGLALSRVLHNNDAHDSPKEGSNYHSDLFAMIGT